MTPSCGNRWTWKRALRVLALASLLGVPSPFVAAQTVRLTNGEWPPYTSESLPHGGLLTRLITAAFAQEGIGVRYGYFPWKRAYVYGKGDAWDGSVGWIPTAERRADYLFSEPVIFIDSALFHLKRVPFDWTSIDDLRKWRIGAAAGYTYGEQWDAAVASGRLVVEEVATDAMNLHKLLHGRIDAVAMQVDVAESLMRHTLTPQEAEQIVRHPRLLARGPASLALSRQLPGAPELLARFNRGLQQLRQSGAYAAIVDEARQARPVDAAPGGAAPPSGRARAGAKGR